MLVVVTKQNFYASSNYVLFSKRKLWKHLIVTNHGQGEPVNRAVYDEHNVAQFLNLKYIEMTGFFLSLYDEYCICTLKSFGYFGAESFKSELAKISELTNKWIKNSKNGQ